MQDLCGGEGTGCLWALQSTRSAIWAPRGSRQRKRMLAQVHTGTVVGIDSIAVCVEVALASALPAFTIVGLPQGAVREGRERVSAALRSSGYALPLRRITVNLAPAGIRKEGTGFDLPIAVGILAAAGIVPEGELDDLLFVGELGLDGRLHPVRGVLSIVMGALRQGVSRVVLPLDNAEEASMVKGQAVLAARSLSEVIEHLTKVTRLSQVRPRCRGVGVGGKSRASGGLDLADVRGQDAAKRALEIAAAGGHNLLLVGPPGAGKTMLARRLPGLLPPLDLDEALEVARVRSVAGLVVDDPTDRAPPFRAPHHSISYAGLVGGGSPLRPGELSLAHRGVLFLDEMPEYSRNALEVLRQPLEEGAVSLARANGSIAFPAQVLLLATMNACPCGRLGDGSDACLCDQAAIARYRGKVSGPLLDRVDLRVEVAPVDVNELGLAPDLEVRVSGVSPESTVQVAGRVHAARSRQALRFAGVPGISLNCRMNQAMTRTHVPLNAAVRAMLRVAVRRAGLSARGLDRVLRVARTIADLDASEGAEIHHVAEALQYRGTT